MEIPQTSILRQVLVEVCLEGFPPLKSAATDLNYGFTS